MFCILMVLAIIKGFSRGLIVAVFSLVAFFIGLIAAMKLSAAVASWLQDKSGVQTTWMPFIAFVLVMLAVLLLIRFGAKMIEKLMGFAMLGWLNKIGGVIFYAAMYIMFFSVILFFAKGMGVITDETIAESKTYSFVAPWGPKSIEAIGKIIPLFKGLFAQLETFFDGAAHRMNAN
jgi:membrane protein required for colicin V production